MGLYSEHSCRRFIDDPVHAAVNGSRSYHGHTRGEEICLKPRQPEPNEMAVENVENVKHVNARPAAVDWRVQGASFDYLVSERHEKGFQFRYPSRSVAAHPLLFSSFNNCEVII